jgi:xanthine phosphoribosyltransferase
MKPIEEEILRKGHVINNDIIKVDSFLNHQIDTKLLKEFAKEVKRQFGDAKVDKVLTIETSGIPVAYAISEEYGYIPFVFAKKTKSAIVDDNVYKGRAKSFTRKTISEITVSKDYLLKDENILFLERIH